MIFSMQCSHDEAIERQLCVMCLRSVRRGRVCICFRVAGKASLDGTIHMETFLTCRHCYDTTMSDYFDFADDYIWKNSYFKFQDDGSPLLYQFDDRFRCVP